MHDSFSIFARWRATLTRGLPTFTRWLTTFELGSPWRWRVSPPWEIDTSSAQQRTLLRMLATATRERLPFGPLAANLADDHSGFFRRRLRRLAHRLDEGVSLPDAVEQTPSVLSPEQSMAVRFGAETGTLPATLERMVGEEGASQTNINGRLQEIGTYLASFLAVAVIILAFLLVFIFPGFRHIFTDFSLDTPPVFDLVLDLSEAVAEYWYVFVLIMIAPWWLFYTQRGWRYFHRVWLPKISRSANRLRGAEILNLLALSEEAGRPLAGAISTLARYFYDPRFRQRLLYVRNEIELGTEVWECMQEVGVLTDKEARALALAPDRTSRTWTMRRLAELRSQNASDRLHAFTDIVRVLSILALGAGVLFVAVGTLTPFFHLISALA